MKATGIVRRIDDLGRVVIPKEIRRTLRIREGDPLEIFTDREGEIILKKYSPIGELGAFAREYAESLAQTAGHLTCIVDKDQIIAVSGGSKKEFFEKHISGELEQCINQRTTVIADRKENTFIPMLQDNETENYNYQLITPIISEGDVMGAVIFLSQDIYTESYKYGSVFLLQNYISFSLTESSTYLIIHLYNTFFYNYLSKHLINIKE